MEGSIAIMKMVNRRKEREGVTVTDSKVRRTTEKNFFLYYACFFPRGTPYVIIK